MTSYASKSSWTTRQLCLAAAMTAVVFLATFVPRIPIPLGYAHLGDAAIFLMVLFIGRREMLFAACFGSALSDLLGGFPLWIVPTLVIKFFMADIAWRFIRPDREEAASLPRMMVGFLAGSLWMSVAYTFSARCFLTTASQRTCLRAGSHRRRTAQHGCRRRRGWAAPEGSAAPLSDIG